jgi:hypothetical protein
MGFIWKSAAWRTCFPNAPAAAFYLKVSDGDVSYLRGISRLTLWACKNITDAAFAFVPELVVLELHTCYQPTITDAAFEHLKALRELTVDACEGCGISDAALFAVAALN